MLSHLFSIARKEWDLAVTNPVGDVRRPAPPKNKMRILNQDEARHLLAKTKKSKNKKLHTFVLVMLHTAMRPSECAGLRWDQVNFDARIADLTITKTDPRRVPLTVSAIAALLSIMPEECYCSDYVFLPAKVS